MKYVRRMWRCVPASMLLAAVALLVACAESPGTLPLLADDAVILAFGDSLTRGTGAGRNSAYPAVLAELSGRRVVNAGVPGEVSAAGLRRLPRLLDDTAPGLLILCHGGNDMLRKQDLTRARRNLEAMVAMARERDIPVLLLGVPKPGIWLSTAPFYIEVAEHTGTPILADTIAEILGDGDLKSDPVHPNAAGYRQLAEAIHAYLQRLGAL